MPRIDKLEMQGFKSFSKKTLLKFPVNFSVICGPNGSGKSNVLDSICFVLGRTSAKSLRADKMLEVIYHGGKSKKQAEFAKVTLFFDNTDGKFPLPDQEIIVSRKVNPKGVSTYKLNGQIVTREKIVEILRAANIHPDGHNIILQGDVTDVIEMSPKERRQIIDEISGISEFEEKKIKAERELFTVEERLKESNIRLAEKEERLQKLQIEKDSAVKYQYLSKELEKLRASITKKRLIEVQDSLKKLEEKIKERETQLNALKEDIDAADKELESKEKEMKDLQKKLFDRSSDIKLIKEIEQIKADISSKSSVITSKEMEIKRLEEFISRLEQLHKKDIESSMSTAVREILNLNKPGVFGTISSLMKVDPKYQTAIEVAAGNHMNDIVVENHDIAIDCINYLKKNKIGRVTFLPLDKIKERNPEEVKKYLKTEGVIDISINLIDFDKIYWHAFSNIFGDTLIINKVEASKKVGIGNARMVSLDGDLIEKSGAMIGGFFSKKSGFNIGEIENYRTKIKDLSEEIENLKADIEKSMKKLSELTEKEKKGSNELTESEKRRMEIEKMLESIKKRRKDNFEQKLNISEEINRMKISKARFEAELENIKAEFQNYKNVETYDKEPEYLKGKIAETLKEINSLGAINQKAVIEYDELKVVYDELKAKVDMLSKERERIVEIIFDIESKRKDTFMKTLNQVSSKFQTVFKDLVGGEGELKLSGDTLDEAGLIISASPPGRKVLNIDSMSGGEKTLTALAFLFAIQQIKPAPFYILDEIDAALDKRNTKKITEFLKKNSEFAQFIVISHNDYTIESADCVYGVSMEEGESKVVGIKMPSS